MRLRPEQLAERLKREPLAPVYLLSGDEPLQLIEARDAIRAAARQSGFSQREVLDAGPGFDWRRLAEASGNLSLFGDRRVLDLRLASPRIGADGSKALVAYLADPPPDTLLLISAPKLDAGQLNSKWVKTIDSAGVLVRIWPIEAARLPQWLLLRMRAKGLRATPEAAALLAERVEGNLLAAVQEIDKLLLLHGAEEIDAEVLLDAVADSARFDVFGLVDAALAGDAGRAQHMLEGLRAEGVAAPVVLWALAREIRLLAELSTALGSGAPVASLFAERRVWNKRRSLLEQALRRFRPSQWRRLLVLCQQTDRVIKSGRGEQSWLLLGLILGLLSGHPLGRRPVLSCFLDGN